MYRKFLVIMILLIVVPLYTGKSQQVNQNNDELLSLVAAESEIVVGIDFQSVKESAIFKEFLENDFRRRHDRHRMRRFLDRTAFNPEEDIEKILIFSRDLINIEHSIEGILKGNFNRERLLDLIEDEIFLDNFTYKNSIVYYPEFEDLYFAFLDNDKIAFSRSERGIRGIIDRYNNEAENVFSNPVLNNLINQIDPQKQAWCAGNTAEFMGWFLDELLFNARDFRGTEAVTSLESFLVYGFFSDGFSLDFKANFKEAEFVESYADMIKGVLALQKLRYSDDKETLNILRKVKVKVKENSLGFSIKFNKEDLRILKRGSYFSY